MKNILLSLLVLTASIFLATGCTNLDANEAASKSPDVTVGMQSEKQISQAKSAEEAVTIRMKNTVARYENEVLNADLEPGVKIVDSKILNCELHREYTDIMPEATIEVWQFEYRIKPDDISKIILAGGMGEEDGWLYNVDICNAVIMKRTEDSYQYLGMDTVQNNLISDKISSSENALRKFLEERSMIKRETFEGNHVLVKFTDSSGIANQILLSQPVKKGKGGIWCVERVTDTYGGVYLNEIDTALSTKEYYENLQEEVDSGMHTDLLNYQDVAYQFIAKRNFEESKLNAEFIKNASIKDFEKEPKSYFKVKIFEVEKTENGSLFLKYHKVKIKQDSVEKINEHYDFHSLADNVEIEIVKDSKTNKISVEDFIEFINHPNNKDLTYQIVLGKKGEIIKISQV